MRGRARHQKRVEPPSGWPGIKQVASGHPRVAGQAIADSGAGGTGRWPTFAAGGRDVKWLPVRSSVVPLVTYSASWIR